MRENQFVSDYYSLSDKVVIDPESVSLDKVEILMEEGSDTQLSAEVLPENARTETLIGRVLTALSQRWTVKAGFTL